MNKFPLQVKKNFKAAVKSLYRFPGALASALVISLASFVRIGMDWEVQQSYSLLFDSIEISFFLGAVFTMAAVAWLEVRSYKEKSYFLIGNIAGIILAILSFLLLYFFGGIVGEDNIAYLSNLAMARISVAIFISIVGFIYIMSKAKAINGFSHAFFISHRAFIISLIYGIVIMIGVSGVLGAFKSLVYRDMDNRIFEYLAVVIGFMTYTIFLGYFPSFKDTEDKYIINKIEDQPRFIFILFEYILIPIIMALTLVLLIWSIRVLLRGLDVSFNQLSSISSAYVIIGIWLYIMVDKHEGKIAKFYKRAYPFAGILILIFEAWAIFIQVNKFGIKTGEYSFISIWIFASISLVLLILLKDRAYRKIAILAAAISIIVVLPILGYADITFNSQIERLEDLLVDQEMLANDKILAKTDIDYEKKAEITDAVDFISYSEKENTPSWFKGGYEDSTVFKDSFGFEKTYGLYEDQWEYMTINFSLETDLIDISEYSLSMIIRGAEGRDITNSFQVQDKDYEIIISTEERGIPKISLKLGEDRLIEEDLEGYLVELLNKYPLERNREVKLALEDMSIVLQEGDLSILIVINSIDAYFDSGRDEMDYYVEFHSLYIK